MWWLHINEAEWPDGTPWPQGRPEPTNFRTWRWRLAALAVGVLFLALAFGLVAVGVPGTIAFLLAFAVISLTPIVLITRRSLLKARQQGWGSNIWPPLQ